MISVDEKAKLRFELANANLQSVSRAQALYLTTLLIYICYVWGMYFGVSDSLDVLGVKLNVDAVWLVTPFITMVLTLAVVGTLNATIFAYADLKDAGSDLFGSHFGTLFQVDTHKNVIDYLALLQILPRGKTHNPADSYGDRPFWLRLRHLIFPSLFTISLLTSYWGVHPSYWAVHTTSPSHRKSSGFLVAFGWICFGLQSLFSARPMWRWLRRLFGAKETEDVYN